jgi:hypothetical protein
VTHRQELHETADRCLEHRLWQARQASGAGSYIAAMAADLWLLTEVPADLQVPGAKPALGANRRAQAEQCWPQTDVLRTDAQLVSPVRPASCASETGPSSQLCSLPCAVQRGRCRGPALALHATTSNPQCRRGGTIDAVSRSRLAACVYRAHWRSRRGPGVGRGLVGDRGAVGTGDEIKE